MLSSVSEKLQTFFYRQNATFVLQKSHAFVIDLLRWEIPRPEIDLCGLFFGYFRVRSDAMNSKISTNQPKNL